MGVCVWGGGGGGGGVGRDFFLGGVSVGMLVVVILHRKRDYFILHFPTSNLYIIVE